MAYLSAVVLDADGLTPREAQVLRLLCIGWGAKSIARVLQVSPKTVRTHLAHIYRKLDVSPGGNARGLAVSRALGTGMVTVKVGGGCRRHGSAALPDRANSRRGVRL